MIHDFFASPTGVAVYALLAVALTDFLLGVFAAIRDNTFKLSALGAYLRSHIAGRVFPISVLLFVGYFGGATAGPALTAMGLIGAAAYVAETVGSIKDSWGPGHPVQAVPTD